MTLWQRTKEWARILFAVAVVMAAVIAIVGWPGGRKPGGNCDTPSDGGVMLGTDDTQHKIYVLYRLTESSYILAEYIRQRDSDPRADWKENACWTLPAFGVRALVVWAKWPPY